MRRQWIHGDSNRLETPICLWRTIAFVRVVVVTTVWHLVALQLFSNTVLSVFAPKTTALVYNHKHTNTHSTHHRHRFITPIIMVARSSIARARLPLYFTAVYFFYFFSRHTFSEVGKPISPKLSHTTWLSIQQNLCYGDFFKVPPKTNWGRKTQNLYHFSCQVADN